LPILIVARITVLRFHSVLSQIREQAVYHI
jgi:hypothetical protein